MLKTTIWISIRLERKGKPLGTNRGCWRNIKCVKNDTLQSFKAKTSEVINAMVAQINGKSNGQDKINIGIFKLSADNERKSLYLYNI